MVKVTDEELIDIYQKESLWRGYWDLTGYVRWKLACLPADLKGKTVLEVGAFEGLYSFAAEQRGAARVLAVDMEESGHRGCFPKVREQLSSDVEYRKLSVYDLDTIAEQFDVVIYYDVYYHLENPMLALRYIRPKVKECMMYCGYVLEDSFAEAKGKPIMYLFEPKEMDGMDSTNVWGASLECTKRMLRLTGFNPATVHLDDRWFRRAVITNTVSNGPKML